MKQSLFILCLGAKLNRTAQVLLTLLLVTSHGKACDLQMPDRMWLSEPQTQHDLHSADLVAVARVVSRSRSMHGSYSATFLLEKILKVIICQFNPNPNPKCFISYFK